MTTDCQPDTMEVLVPSFALQPLVENAIIHGISTREDRAGRIHVRSWMEGRRLWISVADTGRGNGRRNGWRRYGLPWQGERRRPPAWAWEIFTAGSMECTGTARFSYTAVRDGERSCRWPLHPDDRTKG